MTVVSDSKPGAETSRRYALQLDSLMTVLSCFLLRTRMLGRRCKMYEG